MKVKQRKSTTNNHSRRKGPNLLFISTGLFFLLIIAFLIWQPIHLKNAMNNGISTDDTVSENITVPGIQEHTEQPNISPISPQDIEKESPEVPLSTNTSQSQTNIRVNEIQSMGDGKNTASEATPAPVHPDQKTAEKNSSNPLQATCNKASRTIKDFYKHLDQQDYIKAYHLPTSSEIYFTELIQKLLENPPVVSGETNDLFTILQNTAHFFRILGKDNILILKSILDAEQDRYESVLKDFYTILHIPDCTKKSLNLTPPESAIYDYAGFFLNSMGGRLYLFRRDSKSRIVVSYYAILLIDKSNKLGLNKHGINIQPHISNLIGEMESTTNTLILHDEYLDKLYDLQEQYQ